MFVYIWYLLCVKKIHTAEEEDWGQFIDLDD